MADKRNPKPPPRPRPEPRVPEKKGWTPPPRPSAPKPHPQPKPSPKKRYPSCHGEHRRGILIGDAPRAPTGRVVRGRAEWEAAGPPSLSPVGPSDMSRSLRTTDLLGS